MKRNRQTPSLIASNSRWLAYAAASAASVLGGTISAEAEIHYSGMINAKFSGFEDTTKSFALGSSAKLVLLNGYGALYHRKTYYGAWFGIRSGVISNEFRGYQGLPGTFYVSRLAPGRLVSQGDFVDNLPGHILNFLASSYGGGPWGSHGQGEGRVGGFIGFRFDNGGGKQYGWARLKLQYPNLGATFGFKLVDYAWGDPGDAIATGQTSSAGDRVAMVPGVALLGGLAFGAQGVRAWREWRRGSSSN